MTIAVTAVSGLLGGEIVRKLIAMPESEAVVGLARTPANAQDLGIEVRLGDYGQPEQLRASLTDVDTLLLVSGMDAPEARIQQHRNVIEAAKSAGVQKIVYTSIQGVEEGTAFSPVVQSNRQTEADVRASGLDFAIGRNGIYIEPDVDYIDSYKAKGEIANSAGDGKCGYTTRSELAHAYARLLTSNDSNGRTVNLYGTPITQIQLAGYLNSAFKTTLSYREMTSDEFIADRTSELGAFIGPIIGGIYEGIRLGIYNKPSNFEAVVGRPHQSWEAYFRSISV
ncbi:NAD(P)H-binding protein [Cohaesibacter celericrescens]|uniref:NAD(P)-dependent oxidoreductase n=1 Tax=Cohaesibacter celericrescens TaxID=2067669 RepID=A0A2N5XX58_9HYPH|nr:NAD(P)H-binding protein [Cohaesibacter celericrescens]PLW78998.1 NAD(P)-dependent oxidoreductase [Cohaesibacter celericrescens]